MPNFADAGIQRKHDADVGGARIVVGEVVVVGRGDGQHERHLRVHERDRVGQARADLGGGAYPGNAPGSAETAPAIAESLLRW